jgi:hypothetical protein
LDDYRLVIFAGCFFSTHLIHRLWLFRLLLQMLQESGLSASRARARTVEMHGPATSVTRHSFHAV